MLNDLIAENIAMGVILSQDGNIKHLNKWALKFLGYETKDIKDKSFLELVHPDDQEKIIRRYDNVMQGKDIPMDIRYRILDKNKQVYWIMFRSRIVEYEGKPALLSFLIDETKSWEHEQALRSSEEKYRALVENLAEGIAVICDAKPCFINKSMGDLIGLSLEDIADSHFLEFIHPDDRGRASERYLKSQAGEGVPEVFEAKLLKSDGMAYECEIRISEILWEGKPAIQAAVLDLTERKESEKEKIKLEKRVIRMEKMEALGLLAGGVAHDLNNVLAGVVSYPELLLIDLPKDHPFKKPLNLIHSAGQEASAIANDLLMLARRDAMVTSIVNLNTIIDGYLGSSGHQTFISFHPNLTIETQLCSDLLNIKGSEVHLQKAVMNLIINAAESQPSGGPVIISTRNRYIAEPISGYDSIKAGEYVILTVEDLGIGINSKDIQRIFEPFYTKKKMGRSGSGLGMAVVWSTVQDHLGYINVESKENKGSKFYLYFPVFRGEIIDKKDPLPIEKYMGNKERVLVVDDMQEQCEIAKVILTRLNYRVKTVSSGEQAVKYLAKQPCDIILLDMIMDPGIDGLETYKRILKIRPNQKAVVASGFSEDYRVKKIKTLGAGRYIKKPYSVEMVGLVIKEELAK